MHGLPLILAYGALCTGMVAGATVLLPTVHAGGQEAVAAPVMMIVRQAASDHVPNDMEPQANRLAERARLDVLLVGARPPVPMLPSPKPVFVPVQTPDTASAPTATASASTHTATTVAAASTATPATVSGDQVTVLRAPSSVAKSIETDGYRGVRVVGRESDGRWRAMALRGSTEVAVLVDDKGNVSTQ